MCPHSLLWSLILLIIPWVRVHCPSPLLLLRNSSNYLLAGDSNEIVLAKISHETNSCLIFDRGTVNHCVRSSTPHTEHTFTLQIYSTLEKGKPHLCGSLPVTESDHVPGLRSPA